MIKLIFPLTITLLLIPVYKSSLKIWFLITNSLLIITLISLIINYNPLTSIINISPLLSLDRMRIPLVTLTLWIRALIICARINIYINNQSSQQFFIYIIMLCLILVITFRVNNILLFYVRFESSLIPTLLLIIGWGYQPERIQAGIYIILYTIAASLPLLLRIIYIYTTSSHNFIFITMETINTAPPLIIKVWWLITIIAFIVKMPLYTTHLWLPKAHVEAPVAGSMILAGVLLKLGSYGLIRIAILFPKCNMIISPVISSVALWGGAITSFICIRQTDLKSLIAYSRVGHMGLLTVGVISGTTWGMQGALALILGHGLCSSALFALANITYESTHTRSIYLTKGLSSLFPALTLWWFIMASGNIAAPPSINLLREIILLTSSLFLSFWSILGIIFIRFLAGAYSLYLYTSSQHGTPPSFINSINLSSQRNYSIIILHAAPLFLLVMKADIIISWL